MEDISNLTNKERAINFFTEEIKQFDIALNGLCTKEYRKFLNEKKLYYYLAIESLLTER